MTELAQQLIEREKRERSGYLDLGKCGVTELKHFPDAYKGHAELEGKIWKAIEAIGGDLVW